MNLVGVGDRLGSDLGKHKQNPAQRSLETRKKRLQRTEW